MDVITNKNVPPQRTDLMQLYRKTESMSMTLDADTIEIAALSRPFSMGMLYDCRKDKLIPGVTLWDTELLKKDLRVQTQENTSFEIICSDTISEKASALHISASTKASSLCGLIKLEGSASFLEDKMKHKQQVRVSLQYSKTTRFEQLSMSQLGSQNIMYNEVFDQGTATHVVIGILYGAHAFFIFDQEVSSNESIDEVNSALCLSVKKIPTISLEVDGSLKINNQERESVKSFSCKFYGDFSINKNPSTYEEAVKLYSSLPSLLGEKGERAVPVKVWLYPLEKLNSKASKMVQDMSVHLLCEIENIMEGISDVNMQCNDLRKHPVAITFPNMKIKIYQFQVLLNEYLLGFRRRLAKILPAIREGLKEDSDLTNILIKQSRSPFNIIYMNKYLSRVLEEMNFVDSYLTAMEEIKVISMESELNHLVLDPKVDYIMSLNFASLNGEEQYLKDLRCWLLMESFRREVYELKRTVPWYKDRQVFQKARLYLKAFIAFYKVNKSNKETKFIVSSTTDLENPGVSIYLYDKGSLMSTKFYPPAKPNPLVIRTYHDSAELKLSPNVFGLKEIKCFQVEYRQEEQKQWSKILSEDNNEKILVSPLLPNTRYQFRYAAICLPGLSEWSDASDFERTKPTSPPMKPYVSEFRTSTLILKWKEPNVKGKGVRICDYKVEYKSESEKGNVETCWLEETSGSKMERCEITGLKIGKSYRCRVYAICAEDKVSDPSEEVIVLMKLGEQSLFSMCQVC